MGFEFLIDQKMIDYYSLTPYMLSRIELTLMPLSFSLLFFLMLLYWGQAALFSYTRYKKLSDSVFYLSLLSLTSVLVLRWIESGHFPISNLYESLLFLSWSVLLSQLVLESSNSGQRHTNTKALSKMSLVDAHLFEQRATRLKRHNTESKESLDLVGVILSPLALTSCAFAFLYLPKEMQKATALVPALQSNWLMMHVTVMILSYAALLCGSILSMAFLLINFLARADSQSCTARETPHSFAFDGTRFRKITQSVLRTLRAMTLGSINGALPTLLKYQESSASALSAEPLTAFDSADTVDTYESRDVQSAHTQPHQIDLFNSQMHLCERLDNYSYRMLGLGFPLLTVGILSGAVWANSAWGSYWSWDPKETWALITWLVFAMYLHARITRGWSGKRAAMVATAGFFVVWFCYLGVNLLGTGLHSYGWFS